MAASPGANRSLVVPRSAAPWPLGGTRVPSASSCFHDLDRTLARVVYEQRDALATLFHKFSADLHYPRTVIFATGLGDGYHEARLRLRKRDSGETGGNCARILQFAVNA